MPGPAVRISVDNGGLRSMGSTSPQFLTDGRTLAYSVNYGSGFGSDLYSFYGKDLLSEQRTLLSSQSFVADVTAFKLSSDGKNTFFETVSYNNTPGSSTSYTLYTQNLGTGANTKITTQTVSNQVSNNANLSPDGTKLVFLSGQPDLVPNDTNGAADLFVKDLISGTVTRVLTAADGSKSLNGTKAFFTSDSHKIVFSSPLSWTSSDTNERLDVFVKDLDTNQISLVPNTTDYQATAISADGSKILLETVSNRFPSLYSLDTKTGTRTTISTPDKSLTFGSTFNPSYSPDGSKVIFNERSNSGQGTDIERVVITDLATGIRQVVADGYAKEGVFSTDGTKVAFTSISALVPTDTNYKEDVYLRELFNPVFGQRVTDTSSNAGKIYALYQGILGRAPDSLGFEINTAAANAGFSLRDMAGSFLASPEGQARSGVTTDVQFVTQLYRTTLGREPDQAGLTNHVNFLSAGGSRADVALSFSLSTEFLNALQPQFAQGVVVTDAQAAKAARLYYALFDRAPDASGLQDWTGYLKNGGSLTEAAHAFLSSPESKAAGSADNTAYVKSLYLNALDRPVEAAGLQTWVDYLNAGGTRGAVAAAIADSPEAQIHLVGVIENGYFLSS